MRTWSRTSSPWSLGRIWSWTFATASRTPLPPYRLPPSRSSSASRLPVEAPEGTAARPPVPPSSTQSTSRVGFPRESRISRATISSIQNILSSPRRLFPNRDGKFTVTAWRLKESRALPPPPPSLPSPPFPPHRERGGFKTERFFAALPPLPVRWEGRGRERRAGEVRVFRGGQG